MGTSNKGQMGWGEGTRGWEVVNQGLRGQLRALRLRASPPTQVQLWTPPIKCCGSSGPVLRDAVCVWGYPSTLRLLGRSLGGTRGVPPTSLTLLLLVLPDVLGPGPFLFGRNSPGTVSWQALGEAEQQMPGGLKGQRKGQCLGPGLRPHAHALYPALGTACSDRDLDGTGSG